MVGKDPVLALIAGDRRCDLEELGKAMGCSGSVEKAEANFVKTVTGFSIGAVAPLAHLTQLPVAIDDSLQRFEVVYSAAGHPCCIFASTMPELCRLSDGKLSSSFRKNL